MTMARALDLIRFCKKHDLAMITIADLRGIDSQRSMKDRLRCDDRSITSTKENIWAHHRFPNLVVRQAAKARLAVYFSRCQRGADLLSKSRRNRQEGHRHRPPNPRWHRRAGFAQR